MKSGILQAIDMNAPGALQRRAHDEHNTLGYESPQNMHSDGIENSMLMHNKSTIQTIAEESSCNSSLVHHDPMLCTMEQVMKAVPEESEQEKEN